MLASMLFEPLKFEVGFSFAFDAICGPTEAEEAGVTAFVVVCWVGLATVEAESAFLVGL